MADIKKFKPREFEAVQVPYWHKNTTAAKDLEEKYRKIMAWLDENNAYDIGYDGETGVFFRHYDGYKQVEHDVEPGNWIRYIPNFGFEQIPEDKFLKKYEEV